MGIVISGTYQQFSIIISPFKYMYISSESCLVSSENLWRGVLEANKKEVHPKSYFLKKRIDYVNQILKNK